MDTPDHSDNESSHLISEAKLQSKPREISFANSYRPLPSVIKSSPTTDLVRDNSFSISESLAFLQRQGNSMGSIDLCSLLMGPGCLVSERSIAAAMNWEGMPLSTPVPPLFIERPTPTPRQEATATGPKRKRARIHGSGLRIDTVPALRSILEQLMTQLSPPSLNETSAAGDLLHN
jgi:hypothetical protein